MMLDNIEILLEYRNLETVEIINSLNRSDGYGNLKFLKLITKGVHQDFNINVNNAFSDVNATADLDKDDIVLLKGFFSVFGRSGVEGQILNCRLYKEFLKQKLDVLEKNEASECKTKGMLITSMGMVLIILII